MAAPLLLASAAILSATEAPRASAGLPAYDAQGLGVRDYAMKLGNEANEFVFEPAELSFQQGVVSRLTLTNPSAAEHYFTARDFARRELEVAGFEKWLFGCSHELTHSTLRSRAQQSVYHRR